MEAPRSMLASTIPTPTRQCKGKNRLNGLGTYKKFLYKVGTSFGAYQVKTRLPQTTIQDLS